MEGEEANLPITFKRVRSAVRLLGLVAFLLLTTSLFISLFVLLAL